MAMLVAPHSALFLFAVIRENEVENSRLSIGATLALRDIDALAEGHHQGVQEALTLLLMVVFTEHRLDGLRGLLCVVERNAAEEVVDHMVIDDLVEEVTANEASGAVNGSESSLRVSPGFRSVVSNLGVSVLKVSDSNCRFC